MEDLVIIDVFQGDPSHVTFSKSVDDPFICTVNDLDSGLLMAYFDEIEAERLYKWLGKALGK